MKPVRWVMVAIALGLVLFNLTTGDGEGGAWALLRLLGLLS